MKEKLNLKKISLRFFYLYFNVFVHKFILYEFANTLIEIPIDCGIKKVESF